MLKKTLILDHIYYTCSSDTFAFLRHSINVEYYNNYNIQTYNVKIIY